jgi:hypothetical protein
MEITGDHVEWVVVDRLRQMLEERSHEKFNVTQTYALFTTIVCWVVQRIRVNNPKTVYDKRAARIFKELSGQPIDQKPWAVPLKVSRSIAKVGRVDIDPTSAFSGEHGLAGRFLINLRDAIAHGDSRQILPVHAGEPDEQWLAGFTFCCEEKENRKIVWSGQVTLLEDDMRRIGCHLAKIFCDAIQSDHGSQFAEEASNCVREAAA